MGRYKSQNPHKTNLFHKKKARTKRRTKDLDQIHKDITENKTNPSNKPLDFDLPGAGQFYCTPCAKHFIAFDVLEIHNKSKVHKQKLKYLIKNPAYLQNEAEAAAGLGKYAPPNINKFKNKKLI